MIRQVARANHVEMKTKFSYSRNDKEVDSKCETGWLSAKIRSPN